MKMSRSTIEKMVRKVFDELKANNLVTFKVAEDKTFKRAADLIEQEYAVESALDKEVYQMMDDLERQNPDGFQRHKMFPLLKRKLAQQKGIIL